jgi:hypothetical protein
MAIRRGVLGRRIVCFMCVCVYVYALAIASLVCTSMVIFKNDGDQTRRAGPTYCVFYVCLCVLTRVCVSVCFYTRAHNIIASAHDTNGLLDILRGECWAYTACCFTCMYVCAYARVWVQACTCACV